MPSSLSFSGYHSTRGLMCVLDEWSRGNFETTEEENLYPCWRSVVYVVSHDSLGARNPQVATMIAEKWQGLNHYILCTCMYVGLNHYYNNVHYLYNTLGAIISSQYILMVTEEKLKMATERWQFLHREEKLRLSPPSQTPTTIHTRLSQNMSCIDFFLQ